MQEVETREIIDLEKWDKLDRFEEKEYNLS